MMDAVDHLTRVLAIWGAVVPTVAVGWNIVRDVLKRPKIRVEGMMARNLNQLSSL